jgi:hypothetical protein
MVLRYCLIMEYVLIKSRIFLDILKTFFSHIWAFLRCGGIYINARILSYLLNQFNLFCFLSYPYLHSQKVLATS